MKAVTCPQCGGSIKNVSLRQRIIRCDYCGANVLADEKIAAPDTAGYAADKSASFNRNDWLDNFFRSKTGIFLTIVGALFIFAGIFASLFKSPPPAPFPFPNVAGRARRWNVRIVELFLHL